MDEEFESFVVTNPELVDPGIDVSGLRTTTDANILGNISDFPGIQYEAYNPTRLSDLMNLYSRGLPTLATDTAQIPGAVDTLVNVGGGGGGGGGMDQVTGDSVAGFDPGVTPGPSGFIGLDPNMDIDPQDFAQQDYGIYDPPELGGVDGMSGGQATPGAEFADQNPYGGTGTIDDLGADSFPEYQEPTVANLGSTVPGITDYVEGIDLTTGLPETPNVAFDGPTMADVAGPVTLSQQDVIDTDANFGFEDIPTLEAEDVDTQGNLLDTGLNKVRSVFPDFNPIKAGAKIAFNTIIGKPVTLVFDLLSALGLEGGRSNLATELGKEYGMDDIGRLTSGPMAGYSPDSFGGDISKAALDRIDNIENRTAPQTDASQQKVRDLYDFVEKTTSIKSKQAAPQEEIGTVPGGGAALDAKSTAQEIAQDLSSKQAEAELRGENIMDEFDPSDIQATDPTLDIPDRGRGDGGDQDTGPSEASVSEADVEAGLATESMADFSKDEGGTGGGGSSKIVCTMMNESYGFGSFRNKIWLRHSKDLAPEYQKGYHKIFLPLVKLSKKNIILKKVLEHIAVHRTIDIRQESRGKVHLLGRVYRKILEPICYLVGKYAK